MENAITAGLSRQIVLMRALETTANNVANQTTAGFKAERVQFREYLARIEGDTSGDPLVSLVYDADSYTDFSAGGIEPTYAPLDFALEGDGFFAVETPDGVAYTRDGRFSVNVDGEIVTRGGARVLGVGGGPLVVDPEAGPLTVTAEGELQQQGAVLGALGVYDFADRTALRKGGDNLFRTDAEASAVAAPRVRQGFVETSNVAPIAAMTDMIEIMRAYEQAARVVETSDQLARQAIRTLSGQA